MTKSELKFAIIYSSLFTAPLPIAIIGLAITLINQNPILGSCLTFINIYTLYRLIKQICKTFKTENNDD